MHASPGSSAAIIAAKSAPWPPVVTSTFSGPAGTPLSAATRSATARRSAGVPGTEV